ncbi:MAG: S8 family serine peptidase, partial [Acidimicrobiia bacterium]
RYVDRLDRLEAETLAGAGVDPGRPAYRFRTALNGFAARLTPTEAARLRRLPSVAAVAPSSRFHVRGGPVAAPGTVGEAFEFLGLPQGIWEQAGGADHAGEGVVVGIVDSGIHPEHPSFADDGSYTVPEGWKGTCQKGEQWAADLCNGKLVGARYFVEGFGRDKVIEEDFLSARDALWHGSHVAGIAVGNGGVRPDLKGNDLGIEALAGIAPRAHLAVYKTCWNEGDCDDADLTAAIDAAVADGVDVLNLSIGGIYKQAVPTPFEMALLNATEAGVFVSASVGDSGTDLPAIESPADNPWVTAVGVSTLARTFEGAIQVSAAGASMAVKGEVVSVALPDTPMVDAATAAAPGVPAEEAELCRPDTLDAAKVSGRVVLCLVDLESDDDSLKILADAGAAGAALYLPEEEGTVFAPPLWIPAITLRPVDGQSVKAFLAGATDPVASLSAGAEVGAPADQVEESSSRGPQEALPDVLKPDLVAPGIDIVSAVTPTPIPGYPSLTFDVWGGSSMSAAHVAGAAALLRQLHPDWSPAAIRSALMTTAASGLSNIPDGSDSVAFDVGAGRFDPNRAAAPGLVLDVTPDDYRRVVEGMDPDVVDGDLDVLRAGDLNLPSVTFSALAGRASTRRTATSVDPEPRTWRASVEGLAGLAATVEPAEFEITPGDTQALDITLAVGDAPIGEFAFGTLVLESGETALRLPVTARPVLLAAPAEVTLEAAKPQGSAPLEVWAGFGGSLSGVAYGPATVRRFSGEQVATAEEDTSPEPGAGVNVYDLEVPAGAQLIGGAISDADGGDVQTDLDLFVYHDDEGDGFDAEDLLPFPVYDDSPEQITVPGPAPGNYRFVVVGFVTRDPSTYDLALWVVNDSTPNEGPGLALSGGPVPVEPGGDVTFALEWSELAGRGTVHGLVLWHQGDPGTPPIAATLVRLDRR